jgi:sugar transferase (PEP-CTERM/EpsH1 system associated)
VKILWVKAGGLLPLDSGGKIRSYHILRELARNHQVTYFGFHAQQENAAHRELDQIFERVVCCPIQLPKAKSPAELLQYGLGIFSSEPYAIRKYCRPQVIHELRKLAANRDFDVIVCDFLVAAGAIPWDIPIPKVLFTHNVEALIWKRHYEVARNPLWKLLSWREWQTMSRAERVYLQKADHVLAVSQTDRDFFAATVPTSKLTVIPTGVDIDYFQPLNNEIENTLVFTGSMDWLPNEDGIFYFVQEILPKISRQIPDVKLQVVGRKPSQRLQALASEHSNRVHLTGWVDDIRPYLGQGAVCVVPLRIGSGTRLKIFEAMAMAKAVVSTTIGAEGLPVHHGQDLMLADSPDDFAQSVVQLLQHATTRRSLGLAARELVESKYSWASVAREFAAALASVNEHSLIKNR